MIKSFSSKFLSIFGFCFLLVSNSTFADCKLNQPIDLGTNNPIVHPHSTSNLIFLKDVVFDKSPETKAIYREGGEYIGKPLLMEIFGILTGDKLSDWVGINLRPVFGEPERYSGAGAGLYVFYFEMAVDRWLFGNVMRDGDTVKYISRDKDPNYKPEPTDTEPPKTELIFEMHGQYLYSLQITWPVYQPYENGNYHNLDYLGRNETLCLKSASLKK